MTGHDDTLHVAPVGDLIDHDTEGDDCVCGPTSELTIRPGRTDAWLITHHSLDGREQREQQAATPREDTTP